MKAICLMSGLAVALGSIFTTAPAAAVDQPYLDGPAVIVRRTIPNPRAVKRQPLTYERLSTTSTRLIDARRGFRPYGSVHGAGGGSHGLAGPYVVGYDDHFGITRPEDRPFAEANLMPHTGVTTHANAAPKKAEAKAEGKDAVTSDEARPIVVKLDLSAMDDLSYYKPETRKGVTVYRNTDAKPEAEAEVRQAIARHIGIALRDAGQRKDNTVRVYTRPKAPQDSGAVLVASDGTIYTIGG